MQKTNKAYFELVRNFEFKLLTRESKCKFYKALVKLVLTYDSESWTLTKTDIARFKTI